MGGTCLVMALCASVAAAAGSRVTMEHGVFTVPSTSWHQTNRCESADSITLHINLQMTPAARELLEATFWAVSNPDNQQYGKHLTVAEIAAIVGSTPESINAVKKFLASHNATEFKLAATRDILRVTMPCVDAEVAFGTEIHRFKHTRTGETLLRASVAHSLPAEIARRVALVGDLSGLPDPRGVVVVPPTDEAPAAGGFPQEDTCQGKCSAQYVTPGVLTKAYNLGDSPKTAKGNFAVAEFQGVFWDQPALTKFSDACQLTPPVNVSRQIGGNKPIKCEIPIIGTEACAEAMLDIEYIGALGGAIPLTDIENAAYSLFKWAQQVLDLPAEQIPMVMSVSYGNDESQQTSKAYMLQCNTQFQKMGTAGISVIFASGDQGVQGRSGPGPRYNPDFPAASPYITAVGGTDFVTKGTIGPEKAWTQGGGGFSDTFPIPAFQAAAVASYLTTAGSSLPPQTKWNATGRGYPDVSALGGEGNPYCIIVGGSFTGVAGTSAACPVFAATVAKLNELRLAKGGAPLGFLNPWLYGTASGAFNDVTVGRNCGDPTCKGDDGFPAVTGWDAATGLGTPDFAKLSALI